MHIPPQRQTHKHNFKIINATKIWIPKMNDSLLANLAGWLRSVWGSWLTKKDLLRAKRVCIEEMADYNLNQEQRGWAGATLGSCTVLFRKVLMTPTRSTYQRHAPKTWGPRLGSHPKAPPLPHGPCLPFQWTLRRHSIHNQTITNSIINMFCLYSFFRCSQQ